jgi:dihydropyrimidinase
VINYAFQRAGDRLADVLERENGKASSRAYIDYGFHLILTDVSAPGFGDELRALPGLGCPSVKVFTAMDFRLSDNELLQVLDSLRGAGVLVNVHAEDGPMVDYLTARLLREGRTSIDQLGPSRPPAAEALAVDKMVT